MGAAMTPEGKLKKKVKEFLVSRGAVYVPVITGGMGRRGTADALVCYKGRFLAIECKATSKGKLTALQAKFGEEVEKAGGDYLLVYGDQDWEEYLRNILWCFDIGHKAKILREVFW
jgi:hypothetical protein